MSPNGFNPFDLVEDLKKSGFQQKQAEALAKLLSNVEYQNTATKQDLEVTKIELKRDIKELELRIKASQNSQTFQIIGAIAALFAIFRFFPSMFQLRHLFPQTTPILRPRLQT